MIRYYSNPFWSCKTKQAFFVVWGLLYSVLVVLGKWDIIQEVAQNVATSFCCTSQSYSSRNKITESCVQCKLLSFEKICKEMCALKLLMDWSYMRLRVPSLWYQDENNKFDLVVVVFLSQSAAVLCIWIWSIIKCLRKTFFWRLS